MCAVAIKLVVPAICIFPTFYIALCHPPFIPGISGFPTRNNQRWPALAPVCPLGRPAQGRQTDAHCPWLAHGSFSLAETTSCASPRSTSVLFCLPGRRLFDPPKPEYCYSPIYSPLLGSVILSISLYTPVDGFSNSLRCAALSIAMPVFSLKNAF